jgi:hypothetical protein
MAPGRRLVLATAAALVAAAAVIRPAAAASGPLEVIDAAGRLKGKEEVTQFVNRRVRGPGDRGKWKEGRKKRRKRGLSGSDGFGHICPSRTHHPWPRAALPLVLSDQPHTHAHTLTRAYERSRKPTPTAVVVVGAAGSKGSGKSLLLNKLFSTDFGVGRSLGPKAKPQGGTYVFCGRIGLCCAFVLERSSGRLSPLPASPGSSSTSTSLSLSVL